MSQISEKDLLNWAMMIVAAEEAVRANITPVVEVKPVVQVKPTPSHVVDWRNIPIQGERIVINKQGYGVLKEFLVKAESPNFQVRIVKDDEPLVWGGYQHYAEISQEVEEIEAYETDGLYVFKALDIEFKESLFVSVYTKETVKFRVVFAKYKLSES